MVGLTLGGCAGSESAGPDSGAAALRGFGVEVDRTVAPRVPMVHLRTCGRWGCHEQDVSLGVSGTPSALPCPSGPADTACGAVVPPGPGPGYGYAPVPALTFDEVTVTVTTPAGAPFPIRAEVSVRPAGVCPQDRGPRGGPASPAPRATCSGGTPQARLRIAADGTVSQTR